MNPNPNVKPETGPTEPWETWHQRPDAPDEVCRALANGSTLLRWTATHDFDHYAVWHWLRTNPECAEQYKGLADFRMDRLLDEMLELADDTSQDLETDEEGKVKVNRAHFTRTRIQLDTRKCILRQLTTARRLAKDEKPQWSYEDEILKLGNDDTPYDPTGLITATKPAYNPGPPPLSAATRQLGAAPAPLLRPLGGEGAQRAGEGVGPGLNTDPLKTDYSVSLSPPPLSRPAPSSYSSIASAPFHPNPNLNPTPNPSPSCQTAIAPVASPSPYAGIKIPPDAFETLKRGLREYNQAKEAAAAATPHPAITPVPPLPNPNLNPTPNLPSVSAPAESPRPLGGEGAQRAGEGVSPITYPPLALPSDVPSAPQPPANQAPKSAVARLHPQTRDWYEILGIRKLSSFLMLFCLFVFHFALNLHASIHSLSVPIGEHQEQSNFYPPSTLSEPSCQTWPSPRSGIDPLRTTNNEPQTNPSAHSHHSRDAPSFPLNTDY